MKNKFLNLLCLLVGIEVYFYQAIKLLTANIDLNIQHNIRVIYMFFTGLSFFLMLVYPLLCTQTLSKKAASFAQYKLLPMWLFKYVGKIFVVFFLMLNDLVRIIAWLTNKLAYLSNTVPMIVPLLPRSVPWTKTGLAVASLPLITMTYGVLSGAHDYRIRRIKLVLPQLPSVFHGLTIGQISDIHSGSFFNKKAVMGGIEMLLKEHPDVIFFTGDLVNNKADEMIDYIPAFSQLKAPLGVYSVLGNHDYGDYYHWPSETAKQANLRDLCHIHKTLGWQLLRNEHTYLKSGSDQIAIIGVENWGLRFVQHGDLQKACQAMENAPIKILLSHDPSHWDAQVRPNFSDIDLTLSGHTHGFQFGIELGNLKWSPVQYQYKQWAGLYQEGKQYLYVNRGFGYLGYPGRIGILPELTLIELIKSPH